MTWVLAILGAIVGLAVRGEEGGVIGLLAGFLVGREIGLAQRLRELEAVVQGLSPAAGRKAAAPPPPAAGVAPPVSPGPRPHTVHPQPAGDPLVDLPSLELEPDWEAQMAQPARPAQSEVPEGDRWMGQATAAPVWADSIAGRVMGYFTGGNPFVRVGVLILFFGLAFLTKYAADQGLLPAELRLTLVALAGLALLGAGWGLRRRRADYGLVLQGGGVGVLYLTTFAAFHLYHLIPAFPAFAGLVGITVVAVALAVLQDARTLAIAGVTGGFLAPVLVSTGSADHVALFSYYALLNAGIFAVAWRKAWRVLNLLGFLFTFGVATAWGVLEYRPALFASAEPFLILFFLMYLGMVVLYAQRTGEAGKTGPGRRLVDGTLVFGNPLIGFGLQWALVRDFEYGIALSALGVGLIYLALAWRLWGRRDTGMEPLTEAFRALGIIFTSLSIPYAFDNQWSSAAWALEGAGILWVGLRQSQRLPRLFGLLLQLGGGVLFLAEPPGYGVWLFLNGVFFGTTMVAVAGLFSAWALERYTGALQGAEAYRWGIARLGLWVWGLGWWYLGAYLQFDGHLPAPDPVQALVLWAALTSVLFAAGFRLWAWEGGLQAAHLLLPFMVVGLVWLVDAGLHPGAGLGALGWPLAWGVFYVLLGRLGRWRVGAPSLPLLHVWGGLLLLATLVWEGDWRLAHLAGAYPWGLWRPAWLGLLPAIALGLALRGGFWPVTADPRSYRLHLGGLLALYLTAWGLYANPASDGAASPLPYLPLLNPVELVGAAALLLLGRWVVATRAWAGDVAGRERVLWGVLGALGFAFATTVLLRAIHHWALIPYELDDLWRSFFVQASLSIFWGLAGMGLMVAASRLAVRGLWLLGSGLLGLVVGKLFLVDLAASGTLERIVSFVAVGLLLVLVGFFSPLPPRDTGLGGDEE